MFKHPWLAVFLSNLLPGAGQIYGGNKSKGIAFILISGFLLLIAVACFLWFLSSDNAATSRLFGLIAVITGFIFILFSIYSLFDAYKTAKNYNVRRQLSIAVVKKKPWLAVFLSYIFPGMGQFYNNQLLKGFAFIICVIFLLIVHPFFYPLFFLLIPLYLFAIKDAFESAEKRNGSNQKLFEQGSRYIRTLIVFILLFEFIPFFDIAKAHFIQAYKFPSGSMTPTLLIGDHILVDKTTRNSIKRGDLIIFKYPEDPERDFIKRVIALGGDTIEAKDKKVFINGKAIEETYIMHTDSLTRPGGIEPRDNFGPFVIPENNFFVMGDNRDQSYDSRYWGYVPKEYIKGKAFKIYWSWDYKNTSVRWDRIGMIIK